MNHPPPLPKQRRPYTRKGIEILLQDAQLDELRLFQRVIEEKIRDVLGPR